MRGRPLGDDFPCRDFVKLPPAAHIPWLVPQIPWEILGFPWIFPWEILGFSWMVPQIPWEILVCSWIFPPNSLGNPRIFQDGSPNSLGNPRNVTFFPGKYWDFHGFSPNSLGNLRIFMDFSPHISFETTRGGTWGFGHSPFEQRPARSHIAGGGGRYRYR